MFPCRHNLECNCTIKINCTHNFHGENDILENRNNRTTFRIMNMNNNANNGSEININIFGVKYDKVCGAF